MVLDVGAASSVDEVGTWSGILTSCFFAAQFLSSFAIGWLSDHVGKRPLLLCGIAGLCATQLAFGFSVNIWMALALRCAQGLMNCNIAIVKAIVGQLTDKSNRVQAMALVGLMYGVGNIIGSAVGGVTARPAIAYPDVFSPTGFFGRFPYALPNIVVASFVLVVFIITFVFLKEPNSRATKKKQYKQLEADEEKEEETAVELPKKPEEEEEEEEEEEPTVSTAKPDETESSLAKKSATKKREVFATTIALVCFTISSCVQMILFMLISSWTVASIPAGGLNFSASQVGVITAVSGAAIVVSLLLVGHIVKRLNPLWSMRIFMLSLCPIACCIPISNVLAVNNAPTWCVLMLLLMLVILWQLCGQVIRNCDNVVVMNSVPTERMGRINGAAQACSSLMRAVSPITIGPLLEWSLMEGRTFPFNFYLPFFIAGVLCIIYVIASFFLPQTLNSPFVETLTPKASSAPLDE